MKKFLLISILLLLSLTMPAQLIVTDPVLPVVTGPVTIVFDATEGSGGLAGYDGDVYAHTGVITENSSGGSDWRYVKSDWGQNTPETKLTRIGQDLYSLQVTPTIRDYYGCPADEQILKMAFVFRSEEKVGLYYLEGKTEAGGDIFIDVFESGIAVAFTYPFQNEVILELGEELPVMVNAIEADSVFLYQDGELLKKALGNTLTDTLIADVLDSYYIKAVAQNENGSAVDSFFCFVRPEVEIADLPPGIRDGINYISGNSVVLCLLAPYKENIYVIGDFNDWQIDNDYFMKRTPDEKRYWLQIDNLVPGKEYIFQYFIDGVLKVGDPYADKVSDPWNDQYISGSTYPGLIQYPAGKTTGIATVLQTDQTPYDWEVEDFTPPDVTDLVIYELLIRDFTSRHSYAALIDSLDYLQNLGVNAIELMPVNEFEGNISWGYNNSFFFAPDKYYGPKNELKQFIDECHKRGIAVLLDMVLNHAFNQCVFVQMYFDGVRPTTQNPWFNVQSNFTNPDMNFGNDFNHESPYTQALVDSINSYWMTEYKADGFRFDLTKGFGNNLKDESDPWGSKYDADRIRLLKRMADEIWYRNPDAIVIFEHLSENSEEKELADYGILLWGNLNNNYMEAAMAYHDNNKSDFSWISYQKRGWNDPHVVGYMESHDEERVAFKCLAYGNSQGDYNIKDTTIALQRLALNALFFFTIPGPKMIWQFGELGYDYSRDYQGKLSPKPVRWDYLQDPRREFLYHFYSELIRLKKDNPVFESENFTLSVGPAMKKIVITSAEGNAVIIGNFDVKQGTIVPSFPHLGTWYDYFNTQPYEVTDLAAAITLQPGEYRLFIDFYNAVPESKVSSGPLKVYPNPGRRFHIEFELDHQAAVTIQVLDLAGRLVENIFQGQPGPGSHSLQWSARAESLQSGVYLLRMSTGNSAAYTRIIVN